MVGEGIGSCWKQLRHAMAFDDGTGVQWHVAVCGCAALPPCDRTVGSRGG
jgi:hypothetical protein